MKGKKIKSNLKTINTIFICVFQVASKKEADEVLSLEDKKKPASKSTDDSKNAPIAKQEA